MTEWFRQFFALDVHPDRLPTNHGATLVANTAFATVGVIGLIIMCSALLLGEHIVVIAATGSGIGGALVGYQLWQRGYIVIATSLHAGGLVVAGALSFLGTQTIGGPTGILYLASVITAGGFLGRKGAVVDVAMVSLSGVLILVLGDDLRPLLGLSPEPFIPPESLVQLFVFFSIPAWGAYVVAVDTSNRQAWKAAFQNKQRLEKANLQLQQSQQQQAKVADLGLLALQDVPIQDIESMCRNVFIEVIPNGEELWSSEDTLTDQAVQSLSLDVDIEYALFVDGLMQIISTRRLREQLMAERARLASELQKEQRLDALARMAGGVAHDFNNALMVVTGIGDDLLTRSPLEPKTQKGIETILSVSRHISDMTTQLLLFAKGLPIKESLVDVNEVVSNMDAVLSQVVPDFVNLQITVSDRPVMVRFPLEQIERIVLNLVRNSSMAYEGLSQGLIQVSVGHQQMDGTQGKVSVVCLQVTDDGVGMDEDTRERAIEPYFSIRGSTGLGLSTVHGLVEQAGGIIKIQSQVGRGTTIQLLIPAALEAQQTLPFASLDSERRKGRVLLIDDEPLVRHSVQGLLENQGWAVLSVAGREGAESIVSQQIALAFVVCDVRLADELGFDLMNDLRHQGLNVPVLYITGFSTKNTERLNRNEQWLVKPFVSQDLRLAIERLLDEA